MTARTTLKTIFETGDPLTQESFYALIEGLATVEEVQAVGGVLNPASRIPLKALFETGDALTQATFYTLIEGLATTEEIPVTGPVGPIGPIGPIGPTGPDANFLIVNDDGQQRWIITKPPATGTGESELNFKSDTIAKPPLNVSASATGGFFVAQGTQSIFLDENGITVNGNIDLMGVAYSVQSPELFRTAIEAIGAADLPAEIATTTVAADDKATPVDADVMPIVDSVASNVLKKLTWANLKATLKTYLDTLYVAGKYRSANSCQAIGEEAGLANALSINVISIGRGSLEASATSGLFLGDSVFVGTQSGHEVKSGNGIVAIGNLSLATLENALHIVCIGDAAGRYATNVVGAVMIGYVAATERLTGTGFVAIGSYAAAYSTGGEEGVNIGYYSGAGTTGETLGNKNIMLGAYSGMQCKGHRNIGSGFEALYACLGNDNIGLGDQVGLGLTHVNASDNIFIGRRSGSDGQKVDAINTIAIGAGTSSTKNNQVVLGNTSVAETVLRGRIVGPETIELLSSVVVPTSPAVSNFGGSYLTLTMGPLGVLFANPAGGYPSSMLANGAFRFAIDVWHTDAADVSRVQFVSGGATLFNGALNFVSSDRAHGMYSDGTIRWGQDQIGDARGRLSWNTGKAIISSPLRIDIDTPTTVFSGSVAATNLSGTNTGDNAANTLYSSLVSNATHTGDATGATALTLATVNSNVGTFTNASITVDGKGRITAASTGSGAITVGGTPTSGQIAEWTSATSVQGKAVTGSGNVMLSASPTTTGTLTAAAITASGALNLAPITKAALLALTPNATTGGRWRVTDSVPAQRAAWPDGTLWRYMDNNKDVNLADEVTYTPSGTTQTIPLNDGPTQTLLLSSATGTVTATLTIPSQPGSGRIIVRQGATPRLVTLAVSSGTLVVLGAAVPLDAANTMRIYSWTYDGTRTIVGPSEVSV